MDGLRVRLLDFSKSLKWKNTLKKDKNTRVLLPSSPERGGNSAVWDSGSGGGDQPGHQEAEGVGSTSVRGEEPADPLWHCLHQARAAGSGADHRGLELPLGRHHPAAHRSHRCRYCSMSGSKDSGCVCIVWCNKVSVHISIWFRHHIPLWWTLRGDLSVHSVSVEFWKTDASFVSASLFILTQK